MSADDYRRGWSDGKADRDPDSTRLAYGANHCNDYERGYIDSGHLDQPVVAAASPTEPKGATDERN